MSDVKKNLFLFIWLLISIMLNACVGGETTNNNNSSNGSVSLNSNNGGIANNANNVSRTPSIVLTFSVPMESNTINSNNVIISKFPSTTIGNVNLGDIIANSNNTNFYLSPRSSLESNIVNA